MRSLKIFLALSMLLLFTSLNTAQTTTEVFCDSVSNSQRKTVDIGGIQNSDSVKIALYSSGEIDLDSLIVYFVEKKQVRYKGATTNIEIVSAKSTTYSKVLTVNLADGATIYTGVVVTIPKSAWAGYDTIRAILLGASSGNDATDTGQKAVLSAFKY
ncbi:hypothetical protein IT417_01510 [bacterium]|nr:hypothetical protein [bacterium]